MSLQQENYLTFLRKVGLTNDEIMKICNDGFDSFDTLKEIASEDLHRHQVNGLKIRKLFKAINIEIDKDLYSKKKQARLKPQIELKNNGNVIKYNEYELQPTKNINKNKKFDIKVDIILLGDSCVGKTALINRLCYNTFDNTVPTVGIDVKQLCIPKYKNKSIKVIIHDTSGCERFRSMNQGYYKKADGVLLVYDINDDNSLDGLVYWIDELKEKANDDIEKMIVCNKCDLLSSKNEYMITKGRSQLNTDEYPFKCCSAKNGENVRIIFQELVRNIVDNRFLNNEYENIDLNIDNNNNNVLENLNPGLIEEGRPSSKKCCGINLKWPSWG